MKVRLGDVPVSTGHDDHEGACRATLVELVNTTGEKTTGDNFGYRMAA